MNLVFVGIFKILKRNRIWFSAVLAAGVCLGQTRIDLRGQARNVDFSGAAATKPVKTGETLPFACSAGEQFFLSNAAAGDNLHLCTATNTWTPIKGSAMLAPGNSSDCQFTRVSNSVLRMSSCRVRVGAKNWALPDTEFVLDAAAPSDTVYFYVLNGGLVAGYNSTRQILSGTGFTQLSGVTAPPNEAAPIGVWGATVKPGEWNGAGSDLRATVETSAINAGIGLVATDNPTTGVRNLSVDTGAVPVYGSGAAAPPARCTIGQIFIRTDTNTAYHCTSADTWRAAGGGAGGGGTYAFTTPLREAAGTVDCPACVTAAGSYADPTWLTSLGWSKLTGAPSTFTPASHSHTAGDIDSSGKQGSGVKFQMFGGGAVNAGDCAKFDAAGNLISGGGTCGGGTGSPQGTAGQVQFNSAGAFGGAPLFFSNPSANVNRFKFQAGTAQLTNNLAEFKTADDTGTLASLSGDGVLALPAAPPASGSRSLLQLGNTITGGSAAGTYLGVNAGAGFTGDLIHVQKNGSTRLKINDTGLSFGSGSADYWLTTAATGAAWLKLAASSGGAGVLILHGSSLSSGGQVVLKGGDHTPRGFVLGGAETNIVNNRVAIGERAPDPVNGRDLTIMDTDTAAGSATRVLIQAASNQGSNELLEMQAYSATAGSGTSLLKVGPAGSLTRYNGEDTAGNGTPYLRASVFVASATGSIAATPFPVTSPDMLAAGLYRACFYGRVVSAGSGGTVTVTAGWDDGSAARTKDAITLSAAGLNYGESCVIISTDGTSGITYSAALTGATGSPSYSLRAVLERLQ